MVAKEEAVAASASVPESRAARRRLITRALLGNLPENSDPRRNLFHFEQEMAEQFAKNRLSSYAVIPVLVISMGVAIGVLGSPLMAVGWVATVLAGPRLCDERVAAVPARGPGEREPLRLEAALRASRPRLRPRLGDLPASHPAGHDAETAGGIAVVRLAAVIVVLSVGALLSSPIPAAAVASTLPIALCMAAVHIIEPTFFNITVALCTLTAEILFLYLDLASLRAERTKPRLSRREGRALRRARAGEGGLRRGAAARGSGQHGEVAVPRRR